VAVGRGVYGITVLLERADEAHPDGAVVFDDEDGVLHRVRS
jgi:hypothetical protein